MSKVKTAKKKPRNRAAQDTTLINERHLKGLFTDFEARVGKQLDELRNEHRHNQKSHEPRVAELERDQIRLADALVKAIKRIVALEERKDVGALVVEGMPLEEFLKHAATSIADFKRRTETWAVPE